MTCPASPPRYNRLRLASRLGVSAKMIDRMNAIAEADRVPVPWDDVEELATWYSERYRSDPRKPPTQRMALPAWIQSALEREPGTAADPGAVAEPVTESVRVPAKPAAVKPSESGRAMVPVAVPMGPVTAEDALETARRIVEARRLRWEANRGDRGAQREYLEAFEKLQKIEDRSRKAGDTEEMASKAEVEKLVARYNARIPKRFESELLASLAEARRAVESAQSWQEFAADFVSRTCRKLVTMQFQDDA